MYNKGEGGHPLIIQFGPAEGNVAENYKLDVGDSICKGPRATMRWAVCGVFFTTGWELGISLPALPGGRE